MDISKNNETNVDVSEPGRKAVRFSIPGATVRYQGNAVARPGQELAPEQCPVIDLSRGGISFLSDHVPKLNRVAIALAYSEQEDPISLQGRVVYAVPRGARRSYRYRIGIEFVPFSLRKGHNSLEALQRLAALEARYGADPE